MSHHNARHLRVLGNNPPPTAERNKDVDVNPPFIQRRLDVNCLKSSQKNVVEGITPKLAIAPTRFKCNALYRTYARRSLDFVMAMSRRISWRRNINELTGRSDAFASIRVVVESYLTTEGTKGGPLVLLSRARGQLTVSGLSRPHHKVGDSTLDFTKIDGQMSRARRDAPDPHTCAGSLFASP